MKYLIRYLGIFFLIGGILICFMASSISETNAPRKYSSGVIINGQYKELDSSYVGGNTETQKEMDYLTGIGAIIIVTGAVSLIASFFMKSNNSHDKDKDSDIYY